MRILLSRTDSIGDVILSLPMAGFIKKFLPETEIIFLGRSYTRSVISCAEMVDEFLNYDELENLPEQEAAEKIRSQKIDVCVHVFPTKDIARLMKKAGVNVRIGTTGRLYNLTTCNKLVKFSRKNSLLHESQLNLKLLKPLGIPDFAEIGELVELLKFTRIPEATQETKGLIVDHKINLILHPKSKGSAVEWGLENFAKLIQILPEETYHIFISGTEDDKEQIGDRLPFDKANVTSLLGMLSLEQFIAFISLADGLVAASTGPLHISAALNKVTLGLYSPKRPIHPGRWKPIGKNAHSIVNDPSCKKCARKERCDCIREIQPERVMMLLDQLFSSRF